MQNRKKLEMNFHVFSVENMNRKCKYLGSSKQKNLCSLKNAKSFKQLSFKFKYIEEVK